MGCYVKSNGSNFSFFVNLNSISKIIGICAYKKDFKFLLASKKSKGFIYNPALVYLRLRLRP